MLYTVCTVLYCPPQHVDESVSTQLKQEKHAEKIAKLQKGYESIFHLTLCSMAPSSSHSDKTTYAEIFKWACPKFISPIPPVYDGLPENYNKEATLQQCEIFVSEIEQQLMIPTIKRCVVCVV